MLGRLKKFFDGRLVQEAGHGDDEQSRGRLATAVLFVEMTRIDSEVTDGEERRLLTSIEKTLDLPPTDAAEVLELAKSEASNSVELFQFTRLVDRSFAPEIKVEIVQNLWEIALADAYVDELEEHLVRKIANLLHVPHRDFIAAKKRARELAGA